MTFHLPCLRLVVLIVVVFFAQLLPANTPHSLWPPADNLPANGVLVCNDTVHVSLEEDCTRAIEPDMILEGTYANYADYTVTLTGPNGTLPSNMVTQDEINRYLTVNVIETATGNYCTGVIKVEDKIAPMVICSDLAISCALPDKSITGILIAMGGAYPFSYTDCEAGPYTYNDSWFELPCNTTIQGYSNVVGYIQRNLYVTDLSGNSSTCTQKIFLQSPTPQTVIFPPDVTLSCSTPNASVAITGVPTHKIGNITTKLYPNEILCKFSVVFEDDTIDICDGSFKILRTWTALSWCLPLSTDPATLNPVTHVQVIKIQDNTPPVFTCPDPLTVNTLPSACNGRVDLPDILVTDGCSRMRAISAHWQDSMGIARSLAGHFADFPGNNLWNKDTLGVLGFIDGLPLGNNVVRYEVSDNCGNSATCTFTVKVEDQVPPNVICKEFTVVSVGANGVGSPLASVFDAGSYDNCGTVRYKGRRMQPNNCQPTDSFYDRVRFCCEDIGDTVTVIMRVYDVPVEPGDVSLTYEIDHANECMVQVKVQDKIKPVCQAPQDVTVACEAFDPSLWAYGQAVAADNCCLDTTFEAARDYSRFDTLCNRGTITRTFRAFDCHGMSNTCSQRVMVNYNQDYYIKFPNDVIVTTCNGTPNFGEPLISKKDCELMAVSYEDKVLTNVPNACYMIERTWSVINWCTYDPNSPCVYVPNPAPNNTTLHATNLVGPTVSPLGTPAPWAPTSVKISPNDPTATNYSTFWNKNANCYTYKQLIWVADQQAPNILNCPPATVSVCDITTNNPQFWNSMQWWDAATEQHDLCESETPLSILATDACSGAARLQFSFLLYLDLDRNGSMETVVDSRNVPPAGFVRFNNANTPNFAGGELREFDQRPVTPDKKFRFFINVLNTGPLSNALIGFSTPANPNVLQSGLVLPHGKHKVKWIVSDGCGNEKTCEYNFVIKDCKAPTVTCTNGLSVNLMPNGQITLWANDFLNYASDNCTPNNYLQYSMRPSSNANLGFPLTTDSLPVNSLTWNCNQLGVQTLELWARDLDGNADFCETYVIVQDNAGACGQSATATVAGSLQTNAGIGLATSNVQLQGTHPALPPVSMFQMTDNNGAYHFNQAVPIGANYSVVPMKDENPLNGVSTYDLLLISKHILGVQPMTTPYQMIAADANKSGTISTYDIVELRKLILGIYNDLPQNTSWRFVDKSFVFPNPQNPFAVPFPESKTVANIQSSQMADDFTAIKVGDINGNAVANNLMAPDDRTQGTVFLETQDCSVSAGEILEIPFNLSEKVEGIQFTLNLPDFDLLEIQPSKQLSANNFAYLKDRNALTGSWENQPDAGFTLKCQAKSGGILSKMLGISSQITRTEAYPADGTTANIALKFRHNNGSTITETGLELYPCLPNPWKVNTLVSFYLPAQMSATVSIFDEAGQLLWEKTGLFNKGRNSLTISAEDVRSTGVFICQVKTATAVATQKMIRTN